MQSPPIPANDEERVRSLRKLGILDTPPEERFDRITRLATRLFGTEIAVVSLVDADRQWFKSRQGLKDQETSRDVSFCAHAILDEDEVMVVQDARTDERFRENPNVMGDPNIRFYAGCPIQGPDGNTLGTLCVIDSEPRDLSVEDQDALRDLAQMVERELETLSIAITDELTGLANRRGFEAIGRQVVSLCMRKDLALAVCFLDLDEMKPINDTHGHEAGDRALRALADLLRTTFRSSDLVSRMGGDEFCVLLTGSEAVDVDRAVERFETGLAAFNASGELPFELSVSIASAIDLGAEIDLAALTEAADKAMYAAKAKKKGAAPR